ncbi:MAG: hypothetical protein JNJ59_14655 [Deltaproteobacteria bacterium]|nr:hypothetical protein [Deltaproteobacteria bacterium]
MLDRSARTLLGTAKRALRNVLAPRAAFAALALTVALAAATSARAGDPGRPHELGWLCLTVDDVAISQVSAFNRDAPSLSIWVPKSRFYIDKTGPGEAGRVCIPTVVRLGDVALPPETLVFERTVIAGQVQKPSIAEVVVTPEDNGKSEVTLELVGLAEQWTQREGTLTFQAPRPIAFPLRIPVGLPGDGDGPPPPEIFRQMPSVLRFDEPCEPVVLEEDVIASFGNFDTRTGKVSARGIEPYRLTAGTRVARCPGLSLDTLAVALARPAKPDDAETSANWYLAPRDVKVKLLAPGDPKNDIAPRRYLAARPLGGYHLCRQPTWTTTLLNDVPLAGTWELTAQGEWRQNLPGEPGSTGTLEGGQGVTLLDYRETWALVRAKVGTDPAVRIIAAPAASVALPSGPTQDGAKPGEAQELDGGLCPVARGQWRALKANAQSFRVSQDTPGSELVGLWVEIPMGTRLLQLCQDGATVGGKTAPGVPACEPIRVGGAQAKENDRFVLVRYAGTYLAVREKDLREKMTGEFELRRERPWFHRGDTIPGDTDHGWSITLGPGGRISFVRANDHAWSLTSRLEKLVDEGFGFQGSFGVGGDGFGTFITLGGGVSTLVHRFADEPLELRLAVLGELDLRVSDGGGLNFDVVGKAQLRWVNDIAPVTFEVGLNLGYGGTFGTNGRGGFLFGLPLGVMVELVHF